MKNKKFNWFKKEIKHNEDLHTQVSLCNIMLVGLLFGGAGILVADAFDFLGIVYIVSIAISLGAIYLLPKLKSVNIIHANNMKYDSLILLVIMLFGPISTIFIIIAFLLPPKKEKKEVSDETK